MAANCTTIRCLIPVVIELGLQYRASLWIFIGVNICREKWRTQFTLLRFSRQL